MIPLLSGCRKLGWWYWTDNQLGCAVGQSRTPANVLQHYQGQGGILSAKFLDFILFTLVFTGMIFYLSPQHHWQMTISVFHLSATQTRKFPSFREKNSRRLKKEISTPCGSLALTLLLVLSFFLPKKTNHRLICTIMAFERSSADSTTLFIHHIHYLFTSKYPTLLRHNWNTRATFNSVLKNVESTVEVRTLSHGN